MIFSPLPLKNGWLLFNAYLILTYSKTPEKKIKKLKKKAETEPDLLEAAVSC